jgi:hypothetical protein
VSCLGFGIISDVRDDKDDAECVIDIQVIPPRSMSITCIDTFLTRSVFSCRMVVGYRCRLMRPMNVPFGGCRTRKSFPFVTKSL